MVSLCFYFQVHQPFRLRRYSVFDIGADHNYFDEQKNKEVLNKVADKCYLPANKMILDLIRKHDGKFKVSYSLSGVFVEQCEKYRPEVLDSFKALAQTGCVEFLAETYYHSLSFLYSRDEFMEQVSMHNKLIQKLFKQKPKVFRNTELIYNNTLAKEIGQMGYKGIIAEGADHILGKRSPNFLYSPSGTKSIKALLKNYRLSDDLAFRFGEKTWKEYPMKVDKFCRWINQVNGNGNTVNLFMDYETFGEHQWKDTGIFEFLKALPSEHLKHKDNDFKTPSELVKAYPAVDDLDVPNPISWADIERDLSAWTGNKMQQSALTEIYAIEKRIKATDDPELLADWRKLQTSDHFYYMCTKWFADGDVHKYFNPYDSPYDAFVAFMNVLNDILIRLKGK